MIYENCDPYSLDGPRAIVLGHLGQRKEFSPSAGAACPDHSDGGRWSTQSGDCAHPGSLATDGPIMAPAIFGPSPAGIGKGCASSRPSSQDSGTENRCGGRGDPAHDPFPCDPLEHLQHGQGSRSERSDDPPNLEAAQPQTSSGQDLQTQPRQTLYREALRHCWSVSESAGQVPGFVRGREESNPGPRPNPAGSADEEGSLWDNDPRLQTSWHHHVVCSPPYARRQGHRRLYAPPPPSRIYSVPQDNRRPDALRSRPSSNCGQLQDSQTSPRQILAAATPSFSSSLHAHFQFLAKPGRTLVSRTDQQTDSSWLLPERAGVGRRDQRLRKQSQPEPSGVCLERTRGTHFGQSGQM